MPAKVLVILGHPDSGSLCAALADSYSNGAREAGAEVRQLRLGEWDFDPLLHHGYHQIQELEPELIEAQQLITWASHLVFVYPTWWGAMPALLKGFFERTFLPGFAFKYRRNSPWWDKLLAGRSAELLVTMDTPGWYYRWIYRRPGHQQMKRTILGFCGIKLKRITEFSPVKSSKSEHRNAWLLRAHALGKRGAR